MTTKGVEEWRESVNNTNVTIEELVNEFVPLTEKRRTEYRVWIVNWSLSISRPNLAQGYSKLVGGVRTELADGIRLRGMKVDREFIDALMATMNGIAVSALAEPSYWTESRQKRTMKWVLSRFLCEA